MTIDEIAPISSNHDFTGDIFDAILPLDVEFFIFSNCFVRDDGVDTVEKVCHKLYGFKIRCTFERNAIETFGTPVIGQNSRSWFWGLNVK